MLQAVDEAKGGARVDAVSRGWVGRRGVLEKPLEVRWERASVRGGDGCDESAIGTNCAATVTMYVI